jgi:hypothetical protein
MHFCIINSSEINKSSNSETEELGNRGTEEKLKK